QKAQRDPVSNPTPENGPARAGRPRLYPGLKKTAARKFPRRSTLAPSAGTLVDSAMPVAPSEVVTRAEANGDDGATTRAVIEAVEAILRADTIADVIHAALDSIRRRFGWSYGSYWTVDEAAGSLKFADESGEVDAEFQRVSRSSRFREGEGLNGRAWQ